MIVYKDIIPKLKAAGYSTYAIKKTGIISEVTLQAIRKNKPVNLSSIDTICQLTGCRIEDIVEIKKDAPD